MDKAIDFDKIYLILNLGLIQGTITAVNDYYLTLIIRNDLEEKSRTELLAAITSKFDKLKREDLWGVKSLTYPIKHQEKGYYAHYEFQNEPAKIAPLDKMIKLNEDIIRYLLIRVDLKKRAQKTPQNLRQKLNEQETSSEQVSTDKE